MIASLTLFEYPGLIKWIRREMLNQIQNKKEAKNVFCVEGKFGKVRFNHRKKVDTLNFGYMYRRIHCFSRRLASYLVKILEHRQFTEEEAREAIGKHEGMGLGRWAKQASVPLTPRQVSLFALAYVQFSHDSIRLNKYTPGKTEGFEQYSST